MGGKPGEQPGVLLECQLLFMDRNAPTACASANICEKLARRLLLFEIGEIRGKDARAQNGPPRTWTLKKKIDM